MKPVHIALSAVLALAPAALFAQTPAATPAPAPAPNTRQSIQQRKAHQQQRIAGGVKSGQLTPGETSRLEHQEAGINREERGMKAQDNGNLTKQDRRTLTHQQNQESNRIHRDKHNPRVR